ncbi:unnamed protein product, partial [Closterium sp. NIES-54]
WERERVPKVVVAAPNEKPPPGGNPTSGGAPGALGPRHLPRVAAVPACPALLLPSHEWRQYVQAAFGYLRQ